MMRVDIPEGWARFLCGAEPRKNALTNLTGESFADGNGSFSD